MGCGHIELHWRRVGDATGGTMKISEHITAIGQEAKLLAEAARHAGLDADVPTCPGWNMRDLVRHLSEIHL